MGRTAARLGTAVLTLLISYTPAWAQTDINLVPSEQVWRGVSAGALAGTWLDQGAMNAGDQRRDLIVGSPGSGAVPGRVHIIVAGQVGSGETSLSSADYTLTGVPGDRFGASTAAGNIRTTEASGSPRELAVGAPADNENGANAGAVYLFWTFTGNKTVANALLKIRGAAGEQLGSSLATADLDGDGYREIIALAPGSNRVYIFNGGASLGNSPTVTVNSSSADTIITNRAIRSVAAGDINNDGRTDLVLGAPFENGSTGEVWVLFGQAGGFPSTISLPAAAGVNVVSRFDGVNPGDQAGFAVALGDFNADTYRDVFVGAPEADPLGRPGAGVVYVVWGGATVGSRSLASSNTIFLGEFAGNRTGASIVTGDINRDTPNDVVMLAPGARGGTGELDVYYGGSGTSRAGTLDLAAGMSRRMYASPAEGTITSATVYEVTGEGARDVIAGVASADGGPGVDSGLLYFSISPKLLISSSSATVRVPQGASRPLSIYVTNPGVFAVTWTASSNQSWLTVTPASGQSTAADPALLSMTVNATGLPPGTYTGVVTVRSTTIHLTMTQSYTVTLSVRACTPGGRTPGDFTGDGCAELAVFTPGTGAWLIEDVGTVTWGLATDIRVAGDYNGDGRTDVAVYRPSTGVWYIKDVRVVGWGGPGDVPVPGDYNGDGVTDVAVWRPSTGTWYIENQGSFVWGRTGDTPVPGDYNGDGATEAAIYRRSNGTWYIYGNNSVTWGGAGDIPVPADYNGDGRDDVAVFRPSTSQWIVKDMFVSGWGMAGDIPLPFDRDGDNRAEIAVYRPSTATWFIRNTLTGATEVQSGFGTAAAVTALTTPRIGTPTEGDMDGDRRAEISVFRPGSGTWFNLLSTSGYNSFTTVVWGINAGDVPVTGDFDADGRADITIWRPSNGTWYSKLSSTGNASFSTVPWGLSGDTPVPGDYLGAGYSQVAVYRPGNPSRWYIRDGGFYDFGFSGDIPAPADFDGDGRTDIAVFRPSTQKFHVKLSSMNFVGFVSYDWGANGDVPVVGDYDGDGKADLATWRPSDGNWRIAYSSTGFTSGLTTLWGSAATDVPVPGDYNGDGRTDIAVWRPSTGFHYVKDQFTIKWGQSGDIPILRRD